MRRPVRIAVWTLGSTLVVLALLVVSILIVANTTGGRALIERGIASFSGGRVRLAGLSGNFPQTIGLAQLELSDADGVWLTAQSLSLRWSPLALLARHVKVDELHLARLDIERRPAKKSEKAGSPSPPHVDLQQLSIERLELGPELTGERVSLSVRGALHFRSFTDATARVAARRSDGQGDYELTARLSRQRMDANLTLEEPAGGPLETLSGYPGLGALSVRASLGGPRSAAQISLNAHAGALAATAQGTVDFDQRSAELAYEVEGPAMTPRPALSWQRVSLRGHWSGSVSSARAEARLDLADLQIPGGIAANAVAASVTVDGGALSLRAETDGLTLPGPEPRLLAHAPLRVQATMELADAQRPLQLEARHPLFTLQAHATAAATARATFDLQVPEVEPLAAIAREKIAGRTELRGAIWRDATSTHLEVTADSALAAASAPIGALLAGASRLQMNATLTPRALNLERIELSAPKVSLWAGGTAARGSVPGAPFLQSLNAHYRGTITDVSALAPALAGRASASGTIDGPLKALTARVRVVSSLSVRDAPLEDAEANIIARGLPTLTDAH